MASDDQTPAPASTALAAREAVRGGIARIYRAQGREMPPQASLLELLADTLVREFIADEDRNLLRVRVDNACARVRFANPARSEGFLPGEAFLSTTSGGEGLGRIDAVCARYDGSASYRYDPETRCFTTRITLTMPDHRKNADRRHDSQ